MLRLKDSVVDSDGNHLDGDWKNPRSITSNTATSTFPSGDWHGGGDFDFVFTYMPGDLDRDLTVGDDNDRDVAVASLGDTSASWANGDMTGDGVVTNGDFFWDSITYGADWSNLLILGDYNNDHKLNSADQTAFDTYYANNNLAADLNHSGNVTVADHDAFYRLLGACGNLTVLA
jgi:hypothetical protein